MPLRAQRGHPCMAIRAAAAAAIFATAAAPASALTISTGVTASNARTIVVSSAVPTWLEIAEIEAITFDGTNLALAGNGGTAVSTSDYCACSPASKAIDGVRPATWPQIWHSGGPGWEQNIRVQLASPTNLFMVSIWGGGEPGFQYRDNFHLVVLDAANATLWEGNLDASGLGGQAISVEFLAPAVPEPASWMMLVAGLGLVGVALRRRAQA